MELQELIQALQIVEQSKGSGLALGGASYKHTTPTGTPSTPYYTGPGGIFGIAGGLPERDVLSTRIRPFGLAGALPWKPTVKTNPLFAYLTGFRDTTGSNPTTVCSDGPTAGPGKSCYQTAQFGRYTYMTREMEINRVGQQVDRAETFDLRLMNDPLGRELATLFSGMAPADALVNGQEMLARILEVGVAFQNLLVRQIYTGNPANNSAGGGYKEYPGLDILIGTNKVDALTGTDCPSLDSIVRNANYAKVDSTTFDIVNEITYIARNLKWNADNMGYTPVKWVITMRADLFYELTAVWPCSYYTNRCVGTAGEPVVSLAVDQVTMRDKMRTGKYLVIDGDEWEVVLDAGIIEESSGDTNQISTTCFASDVYFIPITVLGGQFVTYMEHFDYGFGSIPAAAQGNYQSDFWTDGGRYLWHNKPPLNWCVQLIAKTEPRLIFRAPFLAARLQNVQYCPTIHTRDPLPTDDYFTNGGVYTPRAAPSYYSDWNLPG